MLLVYVTSKASAEQKLIFLNWNLESESFLRVMVNTVVIDRTNKHSDRCVDDYHSQRINSFLSIFTMYFTVKSLYLFFSLWLGRAHTSLSPPPPPATPYRHLSGIKYAFIILVWKSCKCSTVGPGVHTLTKTPRWGLKIRCKCPTPGQHQNCIF